MTSLKQEALKQVFYIYYLVQFKKDTTGVLALIDSESEVNTMTSAYIKKLGLQMQKTNIEAQKIDESTLETYSMIIAGFQV